MEILQWIQQWYKEQCDGDWEHSYGIKIETLDNPGWSVKIDLEGTDLEGYVLPYKLVERSEGDWYGIRVENNIFYAAGDENKLEFLLENFKEIITDNYKARSLYK